MITTTAALANATQQQDTQQRLHDSTSPPPPVLTLTSRLRSPPAAPTCSRHLPRARSRKESSLQTESKGSHVGAGEGVRHEQP